MQVLSSSNTVTHSLAESSITCRDTFQHSIYLDESTSDAYGIEHYIYEPINPIELGNIYILTNIKLTAKPNLFLFYKNLKIDKSETKRWQCLNSKLIFDKNNIDTITRSCIRYGIPTHLKSHIFKLILYKDYKSIIDKNFTQVLGKSPPKVFNGLFPTFSLVDPELINTIYDTNDKLIENQHKITETYKEQLSLYEANKHNKSIDKLIQDLFTNQNEIEDNTLHKLNFTNGFINFLSSTGRHNLRKFCWVIYGMHPEIKYSPSLTQLISFLLFYLKPVKVFAIVLKIVDSSKHLQDTNQIRPYLVINREQKNFVLESVYKFFEDNYTAVKKHLCNNFKFNIKFWFERFIEYGLTDYIQFELAVRMYTSFVFEGVKVFARYALSILQVNQTKLLNCRTIDEVTSILFFTNNTNITRKQLDELTKCAFKIPFSLSSVRQNNTKHKLKNKLMKLLSYKNSDSNEGIDFYASELLHSTNLSSANYTAESLNITFDDGYINNYCRPKLDNQSKILTDDAWLCFWFNLSTILKYKVPIIKYRSYTDGYNSKILEKFLTNSFFIVIECTTKEFFLYFQILIEDKGECLFIYLKHNQKTKCIKLLNTLPRVVTTHSYIVLGSPPLIMLNSDLSCCNVNTMLYTQIPQEFSYIQINNIEVWDF